MAPDHLVWAIFSPLAHDFAIHLPLAFLKSLGQNDYSVTHHKVRVFILVRVVAHADDAVGQTQTQIWPPMLRSMAN
jgi:hypothetical protein